MCECGACAKPPVAGSNFCEEHRAKRKAYRRVYTAAHKERIAETSRLWEAKNRGAGKPRKRNWVRIKAQVNKRRQTDIQYKLRDRLRNRLRSALKNQAKTGSAVRDLGCTISEFKRHLESKFTENMSWGNYGKGIGKWNIDHIIPLAAFDLTERKQLLEAVHYTNQQPMWMEINVRKSDKLMSSDGGEPWKK